MEESFFPSEKIFAAPSGIGGAGGRGVFASADIAPGEVIERAPVVPFMRRIDKLLMKRTGIRNYYYQWGPERRQIALCLGFGSLYNHSYDPNAQYVKHIDGGYIEFSARKAIRKGEEITINYNGHPESKTTLWTDAVPSADME